MTQESAGLAVLPEGGHVPASQASPHPTPPGGRLPARGRAVCWGCLLGSLATPEGAPGLSSPSPGGPCPAAPLDARAERPWAEVSLDQGLVPLAPDPASVGLSIKGRRPGTGPGDDAGATFRTSGCGPRGQGVRGGHVLPKKGSGGTLGLLRPHPCLLLSASCSPPRLSKGCELLHPHTPAVGWPLPCPGAAHRPTFPSTFISPLMVPPLENLGWRRPWRCPQRLEEA